MSTTATAESKKKNRILFILLIVIGILALGLIAVKLWQKAKEKKALEEQKNFTTNTSGKPKVDIPAPPSTTTYTPDLYTSSIPSTYTPSSTSQPTAENDDFPLKQGSSGQHVKFLQAAINRIVTNPIFKVKEDGKFGNDTYLSLITGVGTKYYPVTLANYTEVLKKSQGS